MYSLREVGWVDLWRDGPNWDLLAGGSRLVIGSAAKKECEIDAGRLDANWASPCWPGFAGIIFL